MGVGGYIAPRHLKAIKETDNQLVATVDRNDSVGIIDSFFPQADFFVEFERFDRHVEKLLRRGRKVDYVSICTPNYLHDAHIRFGLRVGSDVICEKPLVLNPWNIDALQDMERESDKRIYSILQLRLHPSVVALKEKIDAGDPDKVYDIDLTYITSRGNWYYASWKGDVSKSGGIATNIGVHFFDMLTWIFGDVIENIVHVHAFDRAAGLLRLRKANVRWFLSINEETLPRQIHQSGKRTYRSLKIDNEEFEFSDGFTELHTLSYQKILDGKGFGIQESFNSIQIVHDIRFSKPQGVKGEYHPLAKLPLRNHPFHIPSL
jgi:UDP-N-acetyl-2-amino-2-deoxyglucuronate dehydrogenase